jgi:chromosome segregation ATPase
MADDKRRSARRDDANESGNKVSDNIVALVDDARRALDALSGVSGSLTTQLDALERRDREVKVELERCIEENTRLADERDTLDTDRADVDKNIEALEERALALEEFEIALAQKSSDLEQRRAETEETLEKSHKASAAVDEERKSLEKLRTQFEADYGSAAEMAQNFEARAKELTARREAADKRDVDADKRESALAKSAEDFKKELERSTKELEDARATVEQQIARNLAREETLRLREESVNQFRDMLTLMRKGIDDPGGNIGEAVAKATAAEQAAITATQVIDSDLGLSGFSEEEIEAARKDLDVGATDGEIALRLHARRTMRASGSSKWRLPWTNK